MPTQKIYPVTDAEMLMTSKTVASSFITNIDDLSLVRTNWTPEYAKGFEQRINQTIEKYLGLDTHVLLRKATSKLNSILSPAHRDLSFLRTQIRADFGQEAPALLKEAGFPNNNQKINQLNQQAFTQVLFTIKRNLTPELVKRITDKGTNPVLLERIISYANKLYKSNSHQEAMKEKRLMLSQEARQAFNDIYSETIGICKIAASFYNDNPVLREQFIFSKVAGRMVRKHTSTNEVQLA